MPRLWKDTMEEHRRSVREATIDAVAAIVAEDGLLSLTMSRIAEETGVGRATLYKHFPDVEAILLAWHERQVAAHLQQLALARDQAGRPSQRLEAVLQAYAFIARSSPGHDNEVAAVLHRSQHVARGQRHLFDLMGEVLADAASAGEVRSDIPPAELAAYCVHALAAASSLPSKAAVHRLVSLTLAGLRPVE